MSIREVQYYVLACDGCGTGFGKDQSLSSAMEARAAAYAQGWRFPPASAARGGRGKTTVDVCPDCPPDAACVARPGPPRYPQGARGPQIDGKKLRDLRQDRGHTQASLATSAEVNTATVSRFETGEREFPSPATVKRLADALGVGIPDLLVDGWDQA